MPKELWLLLIPLLVVQLSLQVVAIVNLSKKELKHVRFENKLIWVLIIVLGSLLGAIAYFVFGGITNGEDSGTD